MIKKLNLIFITLLCAAIITSCGGNSSSDASLTGPLSKELQASSVAQGEAYYDLEHVVLYLDAFGTLPPNYITKKEAQALGWEGGTVEDFQEGAAIGGTYYGNYEGTLPKGCEYHECDLDTHPHKKRGAKRLVYSDDGRYYYTDDHYEHFREVTITDGQVTIN